MATAVRVLCVSCGHRGMGLVMRLQPGLEQSVYSFVGPFLHVSAGFLLTISHLHSSLGFFLFFFPCLLWYEKELQNRNTASSNPFFSVLGITIMLDLSTSSAFSSLLAFRSAWFFSYMPSQYHPVEGKNKCKSELSWLLLWWLDYIRAWKQRIFSQL